MQTHPLYRPVRPNSRPLLFAAALLLLPWSAGVAGGPLPRVRVYSESNGLPSAQVRSLAAEASGRLLVLSRNGLTSFDGQDMTAVTPPRGFPANALGTLTTDNLGRVWLASQQLPAHIAMYSNGRWEQIPEPENGGLGAITSIRAHAPSADGQAVDAFVAVGTSQAGLWIWWSGGWSQWDLDDGLPSPRIYSLQGDSKELFIGTDRGLAVLRRGRMETGLSGPGPTSPGGADPLRGPVLALEPVSGDAEGEYLWVLGPTWLGKLHRSSGKLASVAEGFRLSLSHPAGSAGGIGVLVDDGGGGLYFGGPISSYFLDVERGRIEPLGILAGLPAEGVSTGVRDTSGGIWLGGVRGLSHISNRRFLVLDRRSGLPEPEVSALLETSSGDLIIGQNQTLSQFDGEAVRPLLRQTQSGGFPLTRVMELAEGPSGDLFVAALDRGLGRLSPSGDLTWSDRRHGLGTEVYSVAFAEGTTWVACAGDGLYRSTGQGSFVRESLGEGVRVFGRRVFAASEDRIILATNRGLWIRRDGSWSRVSSHRANALNNVYSVLVRSSGEILAGTSGGLAVVEDGRLVAKSLDGEPPRRPIYSVLEARSGDLWLGTDRGVLRWDESQLLYFTASHGLAGRDVNRGAFLEDRRGRVWIGTDSGVSVYDPAKDLVALPPPKAEILRVEASGEALPNLEEKRLSHDHNHLFFHVRGIDLSAEERLLCQYRLEGFDSSWTTPSVLPRAPLRYTNLPPGTYQFHFRVGRRDGDWGPAVSAGPFLIRGPFWLRPWVRLVGAGFVALLGWWLFHSYASRHRAALHDPLTGLPNRSFFVQRLATALQRGLKDESSAYALLFLDVDRFKNVNDSLGHLAGDQLLEQIADRLKDCLQPQDLVARLGGDEFTILLEGVRTPKQAGAIAERLQRAFEAPFNLLNHEVFAGASIGIALGPGDYVSTEEILRDADIAMYRAKDRGRGCYEFFNPSMHASAVALLRLETELRRALERSELILLFQPILSLDTGHIASCEALLRWRHPRRGLLLPEEFLGVAEETGLILPIGDWVLQNACEQLARWRQRGTVPPRGFRTSINLAPRQLSRPDLPDRIADILEAESIPPEDITLEVTESTLIAHQDSAEWILQRCRNLGLGLSLDDFGTGLSSLSKLQHLPVQEIKLDRSFIVQLETNPASQEIVRTVVGLGSNLSMRVIAEGVETHGQVQLLRKLGCRWAQGFLFAPPVPGDRFDPSPVALGIS